MSKKRLIRKRLSPGDVVELQIGKKYAYAQFIMRHKKPPFYGKLMRILPGKFSKKQTDFEELAVREGSYCCFWWITSDIASRKIRIAGKSPIPREYRKMPQFKHGIRSLKTGRVSHWYIWDGKRRTSTPVSGLSEVQKSYPIREIVPTYVVEKRIRKGWHPRQECD
jgi:hypothetical protein